jgi:hypothetical protein
LIAIRHSGYNLCLDGDRLGQLGAAAKREENGQGGFAMRNRVVWFPVLVVVAAGGLATWSLTHGQEAAPQKRVAPRIKSSKQQIPQGAQTEDPSESAAGSAPLIPDKDKKSSPPDENTGNPLRQQMMLSAQRGGDWLFRMNDVDGRFLSGFNPALNLDIEGTHFPSQAGAAFALARIARLSKEERYAARATQAIILLLGETTTDAKDARIRYTSLPSALLNRQSSAGLLILAINELPAPQKDVLDQSEQLCNFIRTQVRSDGSLNCSEGADSSKATASQREAEVVSAAQALYGLAVSQRHRPASWKVEILRSACPYYSSVWKNQKSLAYTQLLVGAFTEAFPQTKEALFADSVFLMCDWLVGLQYDRLDPNHPDWWGGFMACQDGKSVAQSPDISTAAAAEALVEGCRLAQLKGDPKRHERYKSTVELALQFVTRLQYSQANTKHFADWYRAKLLGGFHASQQDGTLRLEYAQHAVSALAQYVQVMGKNP